MQLWDQLQREAIERHNEKQHGEKDRWTRSSVVKRRTRRLFSTPVYQRRILLHMHHCHRRTPLTLRQNYNMRLCWTWSRKLIVNWAWSTWTMTRSGQFVNNCSRIIETVIAPWATSPGWWRRAWIIRWSALPNRTPSCHIPSSGKTSLTAMGTLEPLTLGSPERARRHSSME